jgi:hypothetical protein
MSNKNNWKNKLGVALAIGPFLGLWLYLELYAALMIIGIVAFSLLVVDLITSRNEDGTPVDLGPPYYDNF